MPAEKAPRAGAAAVPTTCRVLSPSSLPLGCPFFFLPLHLSLSLSATLGDSAVWGSIQAEASPGDSIETDAPAQKAGEKNKKMNFSSERQKEMSAKDGNVGTVLAQLHLAAGGESEEFFFLL